MNTRQMVLADLPNSLLEDISLSLAQYTVGFVRYENTPRGPDAILLGSGTLVKSGVNRAVLTAHHVLQVLPHTGRLGLILTERAQQTSVDTSGLVYLKIARGPNESLGPDLGAVILPPSIAGAVGAKKAFYDLDTHSGPLLETPPERDLGIWAVQGFVNERTVEEPWKDGFRLVKGFYCMSGLGGPDEPASLVGDHDYFAFPVEYGGESTAPASFKGMSGGGLWQVTLAGPAQGDVRIDKLLLSGVVFYQEETTGMMRNVKCHGRASVYRIAREAIRDGRI